MAASPEGLPTHEQAARELQHSMAHLQQSIADERLVLRGQLAAADRHVEQLQAELDSIEAARAKLLARLEHLDQLEEAMRQVALAKARLRFV